ncbi:MAG: hypothetical protein QW797_07380 [Thermoproteota archaeon]
MASRLNLWTRSFKLIVRTTSIRNLSVPYSFILFDRIFVNYQQYCLKSVEKLRQIFTVIY